MLMGTLKSHKFVLLLGIYRYLGFETYIYMSNMDVSVVIVQDEEVFKFFCGI